MAVTAHWVQTTPKPVEPSGPPESKFKLTMRSELIAFHNLPGRHTSEHLAHAFLAILDRVNTTEKVCQSYVRCF
jgi:hypothetical protein